MTYDRIDLHCGHGRDIKTEQPAANAIYDVSDWSTLYLSLSKHSHGEGGDEVDVADLIHDGRRRTPMGQWPNSAVFLIIDDATSAVDLSHWMGRISIANDPVKECRRHGRRIGKSNGERCIIYAATRWHGMGDYQGYSGWQLAVMDTLRPRSKHLWPLFPSPSLLAASSSLTALALYFLHIEGRPFGVTSNCWHAASPGLLVVLTNQRLRLIAQ